MDAEDEAEDEDEVSNQFPVHRYFFLLIPLAPLLRYVYAFIYFGKSRLAEKKGDEVKQEKYFKLMCDEDADIALLSVIEGFVEAAPQQVLQVSILWHMMLAPGTFSFSANPQKYAILFSFLSMACTLMSFQRNIRCAQEDKGDISYLGSACMFSWHLFVTISRISTLSAMLTLSWKWTLVAIAVHWIIMTIFLSVEPVDFCKSPNGKHSPIVERIATILFSAVFGIVFIFTYIPIAQNEGGNRTRYSVFYGICFLENVIGCVIWSQFSNDSIHHKGIFYLVSVGFFILGCCCMIVYYTYLHPNKLLSTGTIHNNNNSNNNNNNIYNDNSHEN